MKILLARIGRGLLMGVIALAVIIIFAIIAIGVYDSMTRSSRKTGAPPAALANRLKYDIARYPGLSSLDNIPVDLWFGRRNDRHDTTHMRIANDYFGKYPLRHGESAELAAVWPSLRSIDEEGEMHASRGEPAPSAPPAFWITLLETDGMPGRQNMDYGPPTGCEPVLIDESRRVRYCQEPHLIRHDARRTWYWPLDASILTPRFKQSPALYCYINNSTTNPSGLCRIEFSYNSDVRVHVMTSSESMAIDILVNFNKIPEFIQSLEVKS